MHAEGRVAPTCRTRSRSCSRCSAATRRYVEIHPDTARSAASATTTRCGSSRSSGAIEAYARYYQGTRPDTLVLPQEHGHWAMGRWARNRQPGNTSEITDNVSEPISGLAGYYTGKVTIERA